MEQDIRFCTTAQGVKLAFATVGQGPAIVFPPGWVSHLELSWADPLQRGFVERLARSHTVVRYDKAGTGLSDRHTPVPTLALLLEEIDAIVDHLSLEHFALLGMSQGGPTAIAYTAMHPERVTRLLLYATFADGNMIAKDEVKESMLSLVRAHWGIGSKALADLFVPGSGVDREYVELFAQRQRRSAEAGVAADLMELLYRTDIRHLLPEVRVPTLILHRRGDRAIRFSLGRELAAGIANARFIPLEGNNHTPISEEEFDELAGPIEAFLAEADRATNVESPAAGGFRTILFTDIEGHTAMMHRLGDARGRDVLREHERMSREALRAHGGTEIKTIGDSFMASFLSAQKAVDCAIDLQRAFDSAEAAGEKLRIRVGINAGEPIEDEKDLFGSSVILASRTKEKADGGEILVTDVVRQLVSGKGFLFADRGQIAMKGFEEPVRLYEVKWA
jgi:class 3 adenylate cyclase